jgi:hypothetical protein
VNGAYTPGGFSAALPPPDEIGTHFFFFLFKPGGKHAFFFFISLFFTLFIQSFSFSSFSEKRKRKKM